jgi:hypothetical protein
MCTLKDRWSGFANICSLFLFFFIYSKRKKSENFFQMYRCAHSLSFHDLISILLLVVLLSLFACDQVLYSLIYIFFFVSYCLLIFVMFMRIYVKQKEKKNTYIERRISYPA